MSRAVIFLLLFFAIQPMGMFFASPVMAQKPNDRAIEKAMSNYKSVYDKKNLKKLPGAISDVLEAGGDERLTRLMLSYLKAAQGSKVDLRSREGFAGYLLLSSTYRHMGYRCRIAAPELARVIEGRDTKEFKRAIAMEWAQAIGPAADGCLPYLDQQVRQKTFTDSNINNAIEALHIRTSIAGNIEGAGPLVEYALRSTDLNTLLSISNRLDYFSLDPEFEQIIPALAHRAAFSPKATGDQFDLAKRISESLVYVVMDCGERGEIALADVISANPTYPVNTFCYKVLWNIKNPSPALKSSIEKLTKHPTPEVRVIAENLLLDPETKESPASIGELIEKISSEVPLPALKSLEILQQVKNIPENVLAAIEKRQEDTIKDISVLSTCLIWKHKKDPAALARLFGFVNDPKFGAASTDATLFLMDQADSSSDTLAYANGILEEITLFQRPPNPDKDMATARVISLVVQFREEARHVVPALEKLATMPSNRLRIDAAMARYWITGDIEPAIAELKRQLELEDAATVTHAIYMAKSLSSLASPLVKEMSMVYDKLKSEASYGPALEAAEWLDLYGPSPAIRLTEHTHAFLATGNATQFKPHFRRLLTHPLPIAAMENQLTELVAYGNLEIRGFAALTLAMNGRGADAIRKQRSSLLKSYSDHPRALLALVCVDNSDREALALLEKEIDIMGSFTMHDLIENVYFMREKAAFIVPKLQQIRERHDPGVQLNIDWAIKAINNESPQLADAPPKPLPLFTRVVRRE